MEYILETRDLTKVYGQKEAAKDVNLHIGEGLSIVDQRGIDFPVIMEDLD